MHLCSNVVVVHAAPGARSVTHLSSGMGYTLEGAAQLYNVLVVVVVAVVAEVDVVVVFVVTLVVDDTHCGQLEHMNSTGCFVWSLRLHITPQSAPGCSPSIAHCSWQVSGAAVDVVFVVVVVVVIRQSEQLAQRSQLQTSSLARSSEYIKRSQPATQ